MTEQHEHVYHEGLLARDRFVMKKHGSYEEVTNIPNEDVVKVADHFMNLYKKGFGYLIQRKIKENKYRYIFVKSKDAPDSILEIE